MRKKSKRDDTTSWQSFFIEQTKGKRRSEVRYVNITIYDIPSDLLHEFSEKIIKPSYPGGISAAIKDLMRKAIEERKQEKKA